MILIIGIVIGLVLGLTGAGGSIFAVPLLVSLSALPVHQATGMALGAVAISALYGSIKNGCNNNILWTPTLILAISGTAFAPLGKLLSQQLSESQLLYSFTALASLVAWRMWQQAAQQPSHAHAIRAGQNGINQAAAPRCQLSPGGSFEWRAPCLLSLIISGVIIGLLSGLFGVGGGFLIVPLLMQLSHAPIQQAVASSLIIISCISSAGFISFVLGDSSIEMSSLALLGGGALLGMAASLRLGAKIAGPVLQKFFAICLIATCILSLASR